MKVLLSCVKIGFLLRFTYRTEVVTALASAFITVLLNASLWGAVAEGRDEIAGLTPARLSTYVIVAWIILSTAGSRLDENLGNRFRSGQIACDLTKPLDLQLYLTCRDIGRACASVWLTALPTLLLASLLFPVVLPANAWTWVAFVPSLALAVIASSTLAFAVGIVSFRTKQILGVSRIKATVIALLSGAVVPLDTLPDWLETPLAWSPLAVVGHLPVSIFLEKGDLAFAGAVLGVQLFWVLVLIGLTRIVWSRSLRHLAIQGG